MLEDGEDGPRPGLAYLHGVTDGLEVGKAVAWDVWQEREAVAAEVVVSRVQQVQDGLREERMGVAMEEIGVDGLRVLWSGEGEPGDVFPLGP